MQLDTDKRSYLSRAELRTVMEQPLMTQANAKNGSLALVENGRVIGMRNLHVMLVLASLALSGEALADAPEVGGWRNLGLRPEVELNGPKSAFAVLHHASKLGVRFSVLDRTEWRAVCCVEIASPPLSEVTLAGSYRVPSVWTSDMAYNWDEEPGFKSYVFALKGVGELPSHRFSGAHYESGEWGGLLLPADARTSAPDKVTMSGKRYTVKMDAEETADGEGVTERYRLIPDSGGPEVRQNVRFTNY